MAASCATSDSEIGRGRRNPFISSPTICSLSAALPPLPQIKSFLPDENTSVSNRAVSTTSSKQGARAGYRSTSLERCGERKVMLISFPFLLLANRESDAQFQGRGPTKEQSPPALALIDIYWLEGVGFGDRE